MPALRLRGMDFEPTVEAYAELTLSERLRYVEGALDDYATMIRRAPPHKRTTLRRQLVVTLTRLRQARQRLRDQVASKAQD